MFNVKNHSRMTCTRICQIEQLVVSFMACWSRHHYSLTATCRITHLTFSPATHTCPPSLISLPGQRVCLRVSNERSCAFVCASSLDALAPRREISLGFGCSAPPVEVLKRHLLGGRLSGGWGGMPPPCLPLAPPLHAEAGCLHRRYMHTS